MIQDIFPKKLNNSYREEKAEPYDNLMVFDEGRLFLKFDETSGEIIFPTARSLGETVENFTDNLTYLFSIDDEKYFLKNENTERSENNFAAEKLREYEALTLREIRALKTMSKDKVFAAYTAFHLWKWYSDNKYCGKCGGRLVHDNLEISQGKLPERALFCKACNNKIYPRINPAVIIGVTNGDKMVITRYRRGYANNALIAGFTEIGETLEQTVEREVMEEVGLHVKNIRYYKSQPWGMALDLLAGFFCEVDGDTEIKMDESELKYAEWVKREDIELQPSDYSLTNEMMKLFKNREVE